jgi:peptidoglycan/xylan/chitin deacetylase (PgdA/CDA1 family)
MSRNASPVDPAIHPRKRQVAAVLGRAGILDVMLGTAARAPHVRCVNYHHVPAERAEAFERQLIWFAANFVGVGPEELLGIQQGSWPHHKPGILLSFDDGCRTHAEVVAPLLEKHGFVGWFFVPSAFCDVPVPDQRIWAREHRVSAWAAEGDPRLALRWDQVQDLARRHIVGTHTRDHVRLGAELSPKQIREQVVDGKLRLEHQIGREVQAFAWPGGEDWAYSAAAQEAIVDAELRFAFRTNNLPFRPGGDLLGIERTNIEAGYPLDVVRFQLSGLLDWIYAPKRQRVARRLQGGHA